MRRSVAGPRPGLYLGAARSAHVAHLGAPRGLAVPRSVYIGRLISTAIYTAEQRREGAEGC